MITLLYIATFGTLQLSSKISVSSDFGRMLSVGTIRFEDRFCTRGWDRGRWVGPPLCLIVVLCPDCFSHAEGKNSLVNCQFNFCSMRFKIGDTTSSKMYYVTSHKAWNYKRALKRQLLAGIILLGASERQETKIHKTWSLCQPEVQGHEPTENMSIKPWLSAGSKQKWKYGPWKVSIA